MSSISPVKTKLNRYLKARVRFRFLDVIKNEKAPEAQKKPLSGV